MLLVLVFVLDAERAPYESEVVLDPDGVSGFEDARSLNTEWQSKVSHVIFPNVLEGWWNAAGQIVPLQV